jgi:hypothetical protein
MVTNPSRGPHATTSRRGGPDASQIVTATLPGVSILSRIRFTNSPVEKEKIYCSYCKKEIQNNERIFKHGNRKKCKDCENAS